VALVLLPGYSYSDSIAPYYGQTGNAAGNGLNWTMGDVLPTPPGLDINAVIYNYTIRKQTEDSVTVHVQNENANGTGYIFRETDEWKPGSLDGTQINKVVGVGTVHRDLWGDGSIVTEGNGSVEDPTVVYTYRVDPCYDPQYDPNCPGYQVPVPDVPEVSYEIYDATAGDADQAQYNPDDELYEDEERLSDEEQAKQEEEEEKDSKERLEKALAAADNSAMFAQALAQSRVLDQMNLTTNMNTYYAATIPGGTYAESVTLVDKQLPDNKQGLRNNRAQQLLHQQMVDEQYK
jgi:hypothetical protein